MPQLRSVDIDQVVKDWAWRTYERTATSRKQKRLLQKEKGNTGVYLGCRINWTEVKFIDETDWPSLAEEKTSDNNANNTRSVQPADLGRTHANILFQTKFTNNTQEGQEYTLRTEKTTRSSCSTEVETSYTRGIEMSCNLKTPGEIFECNAGYSRELSLTNNSGETLEEELTWGVESLIKVKAQHVAEAQLVVNEKKYGGDFTITTTIQGQVFVHFTNIKDNNALVKGTSQDIAHIFKEYLQTQRRIGGAVDFIDVQDDQVLITTKGRCKFRFGIKQEVVVNQIPLNSK